MADKSTGQSTTTSPAEVVRLMRIYFHSDDVVSFTRSGERVKEVEVATLSAEFKVQVAAARAEQQARKDVKAAEEAQHAWYEKRRKQVRARRNRNPGGRSRR